MGRGGPSSNKAFALRFIIKSADRREVGFLFPLQWACGLWLVAVTVSAV